jgi:DNA-binding MarR family transcriptional regulator
VADVRRRGRPRKSSSSGSPATRGIVKVDSDFAEEYPDGDAAAAEIFGTLIRVGQALSYELDRASVATFGVPQAVLNSLAIVEGAGEPLTPTEISERTLISSATMTNTLDTLEHRGWVRRVPNPEDRRSVLIEITDEGKAIADQLLPGTRKLEMAVCAGLTSSERKTAMKLLAKVLDQAVALGEAEPMPLNGRRNRPARLN